MQASEIMIKQLGYKKAKVMLQGLGNEHDAALLEYRRQNNIFEVGDPIICTCKDADIKEVLFAKENFNSEKSGLVKCGDKGHMSFTCMLDVKDIRHANDAEIEAGRRLDLPESVVKSLGEVP